MSSPGEIKSAAGTQSVESFTDALTALLPPIYEKENKNTILNRLNQAVAEELVKADILIETVGNNNYLTVDVSEEIVIRSSGALDRLGNEGAYELDSVRLTGLSSTVNQNTKLEEGINEIQLFFIPQSSEFVIAPLGGEFVDVGFPTAFDTTTNTLTILANRAGQFTITYVDTGDVVRLSENITIPTGLFRLGWSEGGYGELGWSE